MAKKGKKAAKQASQKARQQGGGRGGKAPMSTLWLSITFALLVVVSLPTVMLLFFGMLPTIIAYIVDRTPQKYATFTVGGLNFCGVFPYVLDLWMGLHSIGAAMDILTDVFSLVVMYGSAAVGRVLYGIIPPVVVSVLTVLAQRRVAQLRTTQRRIIEEWGEEVAEESGANLDEVSA